MKKLSILALVGAIALLSQHVSYGKIPQSFDKKTNQTFENISLKDKLTGMLTLSAYGDAQARVTEFKQNPFTLQLKRPDSADHNGYPTIPQLKSIRTNQIYARFTDDTHMSLYLTHALIQTKHQPIETILNALTTNFINWLHADQLERAPGIACKNNTFALISLQNAGITGVPLWSRKQLDTLDISTQDSGLKRIMYNKEGGSGAIMRVAPVSIVCRDNPALAEQLSVTQGILTHTDSDSRAACAGLNAALQAILNNRSIDELFNTTITKSFEYDPRPYTQEYNPKLYKYGSSHFTQNGCSALCKQALHYYQQGTKAKPWQEVLDQFRGWGATEALAASLYIYTTWNHDPYLAMSIAINRTPGDSDTIAKIVGEMLGLQYGYNYLKDNFAQHGLDLDSEITYLEQIKDLQEYQLHFPKFVEHEIKTFHDLANFLAHF